MLVEQWTRRLRMNDVHVRDGVIKGMYAVNATDHKALTRVVGDDIRDVSDWADKETFTWKEMRHAAAQRSSVL